MNSLSLSRHVYPPCIEHPALGESESNANPEQKMDQEFTDGENDRTAEVFPVSDTGLSNAYLRTPLTTLKQWMFFHAVVECGSFASAAESLEVSQPTISYTIARLEEVLGVHLLQLDGRKSQLTDAGRELLKRSRFLLHEAAALEKLARVVRDGVKPEIRLAVSLDFPTRLLIHALRVFSDKFEHAKLRLIEVSSIEVERVLQNHEVDIAITTSVPQGFVGDLFTQLEYVAVARPDHPLFSLARALEPDDLSGEVQIISLADYMANSAHVIGQRPTGKHWYVSKFETAIAAICEGIGYGWVAEHRVRELLDGDKLKILPLQSRSTYAQNFYLIRDCRSGHSADTDHLTELLLGVARSVEKDRNGPLPSRLRPGEVIGEEQVRKQP